MKETSSYQLDNYGSENNPIKLSCTESVIVLLNSIVTESGFHILYHLKDYVVKQDSIIEVYEIFSGIEEFYFLYFDITNEIDIWVAPQGFLFKYDWIECNDNNFIHHGQDFYYKGGESSDKPFKYYHLRNWKIMKILLLENFGVNYKVENFPESVFQMYYDYDYPDIIDD